MSFLPPVPPSPPYKDRDAVKDISETLEYYIKNLREEQMNRTRNITRDSQALVKIDEEIKKYERQLNVLKELEARSKENTEE